MSKRNKSQAKWLYPKVGNRLLDAARAIPGWLAKNEILALNKFAQEALNNIKDDEILVEIGSFMGRSTVAIAFACKSKKKGKLLAIDPHRDTYTHRTCGVSDSLSALKSNVARNNLTRFVEIKRAKSKEAFGEYVNAKTKFVFIDGGHEYSQIRGDFLMWSTTLQPKGYLLLHDTLNIEGSRKVMFEILKHKQFAYIKNVGDLACFQKKERLTLRNWAKKIYGLFIFRLFFFRVYKPTIS